MHEWMVLWTLKSVQYCEIVSKNSEILLIFIYFSLFSGAKIINKDSYVEPVEATKRVLLVVHPEEYLNKLKVIIIIILILIFVLH